MSLVQRATAILTQPKNAWPAIANEPASTISVFTGYAVILAAIPAVVGILPSVVWGGATGLVVGLVGAVLGYVFGLGVLFLMGIIANALSPSFGGIKSDVGAMKLVVYSATPIWVVGILTGLLGVIPILGALIGLFLFLAAYAYGAYLIYLGAPHVLRIPPDKAIVFTIVLLVIWLVLYFIAAAIIGTITAILVVGAAATAGAGALIR